jgi:hypothetical protein
MARGGKISFSKGGRGISFMDRNIDPCNLQALRHGEFYASRRYLGTRVDNDYHFASFFGKKRPQKIIIFHEKLRDYRDNRYFAKN